MPFQNGIGYPSDQPTGNVQPGGTGFVGNSVPNSFPRIAWNRSAIDFSAAGVDVEINLSGNILFFSWASQVNAWIDVKFDRKDTVPLRLSAPMFYSGQQFDKIFISFDAQDDTGGNPIQGILQIAAEPIEPRLNVGL